MNTFTNSAPYDKNPFLSGIFKYPFKPRGMEMFYTAKAVEFVAKTLQKTQGNSPEAKSHTHRGLPEPKSLSRLNGALPQTKQINNTPNKYSHQS